MLLISPAQGSSNVTEQLTRNSVVASPGIKTFWNFPRWFYNQPGFKIIAIVLLLPFLPQKVCLKLAQDTVSIFSFPLKAHLSKTHHSTNIKIQHPQDVCGCYSRTVVRLTGKGQWIKIGDERSFISKDEIFLRVDGWPGQGATLLLGGRLPRL